MNRDYYSLLFPTIRSLDENTPVSRRAIYARARSAIVNADLETLEVQEELGALERAIDRIEEEVGRYRAPGAAPKERSARDRPASEPTKTQRKVRPASAAFRPTSFLLIGVVAFSIAVVGYLYWSKSGKTDRSSAANVPISPAVISESNKTSNENLPHTLNRQLVYYRSTHAAGTIVIAKSQRFLYLVRPDVIAVRYTIDVGGECSKAVGLLLVSGKEEDRRATQNPGLSHAGAHLYRVDAREGGASMGARSLALGDTGLRIHNLNATANSEVACFRLVNDDMVDLYDRVSVGNRVIVN